MVSKVLDITNQLSSEESEKSGGEKSPGTSLLKTLDKFALQSFNASFQSIESNNTSKAMYAYYTYLLVIITFFLYCAQVLNLFCFHLK